MPKSKEAPPLVATTGLDYLATTGRFRRVEPGDLVDQADVDPKALRWMRDAGFLAPSPSDDNQDEGTED
jgi:hypothetical protein